MNMLLSTGRIIFVYTETLTLRDLHCALQIYYNDTGELLCDQRSVFGEDNPNRRFNEPGYINRPPCLWGPAKYGLEPPPKIGGRVLRAVAITNATSRHHGEMGIPVFYTVAEP